MAGKEVTWLHLSDLHSCKEKTGWDAHRVTQAIVPDLKKLQDEENLRPDLVFFTGDLAYGQLGSTTGLCLTDQFAEGADLLDSVRQAFSVAVPKDRTFIVPGNHDVNRRSTTPEQDSWLERRQSADDVINMIHEGQLQWERYVERQKEYRVFLEQHGYRHLLSDSARLIYAATVPINGINVGIAGFNSSWSCCKNGEKGKLWVGGRWQGEVLGAQLDGADLKIGLIHHPEGWYNEYEAKPFWRHILQKSFDFVLHGHEHDAWVEPLVSGHTTIAAGACYDRSDRPNGYNLVRVNLDREEGEVWLRRYESRGGGWVADVVHGSTDDRGVWKLSTIRRQQASSTPKRARSVARTTGSARATKPPSPAKSIHSGVATPERLHAVLSAADGPAPILLLGGGASVRSGIPGSLELVERIAKWAYCRSHARYHNDPTVRRSDWLPWLQKHSWYRRAVPAAENFAEAFEHLLQPREARIEFLRLLNKPGVPGSAGYKQLADMLAAGSVRTILFAGFDTVLADLCAARHRPHHVEVIRGPESYGKVSTSPHYPQLIYLLGDVDKYAERNLLDPDEKLDPTLIARLTPLLRDHPLIVMGYSGADQTLMRQLLIDQTEGASGFRHGIFWCDLPSIITDGPNPLVKELANVVGANFQLVSIDGFDEFFEKLPRTLLEGSSSGGNAPGDAAEDLPVPTDDMEPVAAASDRDLDWVRIRSQIVEFCRRTDIEVPRQVTQKWLSDQLCQLDLLRSAKSGLAPTLAGYLLFAQKPQENVPQGGVLVTMDNEQETLLEGNLFALLDRISAILDEVNVPFLLKGAISEQVYPYPPIALRELVVNALVHRDYAAREPVKLRITTIAIELSSPGGLVGTVHEALNREGIDIQERIEAGARGLKGYRNPVIADIFYGSGVMEKAGSGLADVQQLVKEAGGKVTFGPTAANDRFDVTIYCRPEAIKASSGTATPLISTARFVSNLLEVVELPATVWHASTSVRKAREIWEATEEDVLPPFLLHNGRLFAFSNLSEANHPLKEFIDRGDVESLESAEFANTDDGQKRLVWLLHEALYRHFEACEVAVDKKRKRAYFTRTDAGERVITYQATAREATRTVTKPIISKSSQTVRYWEHKSVRFGFERYGDTWALQLVPGYAFTVDGYYKRLAGPRVSSLATRRSAHDYNMQVHNDLVFWAWVLAKGGDSIHVDCGPRAKLLLKASFAAYELRDVSPAVAPAEPDESEIAGLSLEEIEDRLAEEAARGGSAGMDKSEEKESRDENA